MAGCFFYKQSAARFTERGTTLDGEVVRAFPSPRLGYQWRLDRFDWQSGEASAGRQLSVL